MASSNADRIDLPAPHGWRKLFTPKKGGTPRRNEIIFVSPTGEEIKNKRQLDQYLKYHPGGPSVSEFVWSTGETPRRSKRLSDKFKVIETPESEPARKRQNKKQAKEKDDIDGEGKAAEEKEDAAVKDETKASTEVEMKDAEDVGDKSKGEASIKEDVTPGDTEKDSESKAEEKIDEMNILTTTNTKKEQVVNNSLPVPGLEETEKQPAETEVPTRLGSEEADNQVTFDAKEQIGSESTAVPEENKEEAEKEIEAVKEAFPDADTIEKESEEAKVGKEEYPNKELSAEKKASDGETKANSDGLKPMDNHSVTLLDAKASQLGC